MLRTRNIFLIAQNQDNKVLSYEDIHGNDLKQNKKGDPKTNGKIQKIYNHGEQANKALFCDNSKQH